VSGERLLLAERIKEFPGVRALEAVDFDVRPGEIHALLGQNGAGKSTLMNILAGVIPHDAGRLFVGGEPVTLRGPLHAQALGISIVHQELSLFPSRSIAENIFVGRLPQKNGFVDQPKLLADAREALAALEINLDPRTLIRKLPFSNQQTIEIAKALSFGGRLLILDEPTSALTEHESAILFRHLRRLREQGMGIIYISHRLREVFELSDRITVLRDGRLVGTFDAGAVTQADVVSMMVSRNISAVSKPNASAAGRVSLSVRRLRVGAVVRGVDIDLHHGEILGLAGLAGAGQADIGRALGGLTARRVDSIDLDGVPFHGKTPREAMQSGVVYLPADRRGEGLFLGLDVQQNVVASSLGKLRTGPWMNDGEASKVASGFVDSLGIRTPSLHQRVANLSGGNQQKVVLARGLTVDAQVFIADEPTRGVDVGAKAEIYGLLRRLAASGKSILLISTELPELLAMSDRILVIAGGLIAGELSAAEATEERVMMLASSQLAIGGEGEHLS
jgi:ABC-type sugar transport system ATPase subunit